MASTYTDIGTELMTTGENAGNWGTKTNTNLKIIEEAVRGYVAQSIAGGADTTALTYTDGSTGDAARNMVIALTGSITGNQVVTVTAKEKVWIVDNQTSGAYTVQFMVSGQTGVTWAATDKGTKILYCNGTDVIDTGITSAGAFDLDGKELILDADADTSLTADTDDQIDIKIAGTDQLTIKDGALSPVTTNDIDLGTASLEFKDAYFDGTVTSDAFAGPLTGNVTGNASGTAATVTTAAQSNITSLGTLTTLTVDNVITNGATIGHTSDTDLITLADGAVTVAGTIGSGAITSTGIVTGTAFTAGSAVLAEAELELLDGLTAGTAIASKVVTTDASIDTTGQRNLTISGELDAATGDFSGDVDVDGTMEADAYTLEGSAFIKVAGTNFTNSLLVGHATTGTLSSADGNTGVGFVSLDALTSGDNNTAIGYNSLSTLTTGTNNVGLGGWALKATVDGGNNTAVGYLSQKDATGGSGNTSLGYDSLEDVTGDNNIAIGKGAGKNITSGDGNVIIGQIDADSATGDKQLIIADGVDGSVAWLKGDSSGNLTFPGALQVSGAVTVGVDDTGLDVKLFGASAGAYMEWDESIDTLRIVGASADATTSTGKLLLATSLTDINASDVIGKIDFQAPLEAGGTDAITVAASIQAMAQGTFSASVNATDLIFFTGHSEAATEKFRFTSQGEIGVGGANYGTDGQVLTSAGAGAAPAWEDAAGGLTGKVEGTNFTGSLLVGHSTTGTLSSASQNTGVGINALNTITQGDRNVAVGHDAGTAITTGSDNIAMGRAALTTASTALQNTGVGGYALQDATGSYNSGIGYGAGKEIAAGDYNICLGYLAGDNITSGSGNVVIGKADVSSATADDQLSISDGEDGSVVWMTGDSSANITFAAEVAAATLDISGAIDIDGTANLDTVDIDGAVQIDAAFTSGVDGQGYDTKFFGDTSSAYMLWDTSADDLVFAGAAGIDLAGDIDVDGTANLDVVDIDGAVDMASTLAVAGVSSFAVAANVAQAAITSSSNAVAWDASAKPNAYHITTENTTLSAPSNAVEGAFICIEINFNGSHTFAWNAIFNFAADTAPTTTDTDAKTDILVFRYNGAIWQEVGRTLNIPES